jgi:hypothetical protein
MEHPLPPTTPPAPLPRTYRPPGEVVLRVDSQRVPDDEEATELTLQPVDPATEAARQRIREFDRLPTEPLVEKTEPPRLQYSLGQILFGMSACAVALALTQALAPSLIAGTVGLVAFSALIAVLVCQPERREVHAIAWGLLVLYVLLAVVALARG